MSTDGPPGYSYCFCRRGESRWPVRPDDRHCGLCGLRLLGLSTEAPTLGAGLGDGVVVYLRRGRRASGARGRGGEPPGMTGSLRLRRVGATAARPRVEWTPEAGSAVGLDSWRVVDGSAIELTFRAEGPAAPGAGPLGLGLLVVSADGLRSRLPVHAYAVEEARARCWLSTRPDSPSPDGRTHLVIHEGGAKLTTFLGFTLGREIPLLWDSISSDDPAVAVEPLAPGEIGLILRAKVVWDSARMPRGDRSRIAEFTLKFRDVGRHVHRQPVLWRSRQPLSCRPPAISLASLIEGRPESRTVRVVNQEPAPIVIREVDPDVPWVSGARDTLPIRLEPGSEALLTLDFLPEPLDGRPGPHDGSVVLRLSGRATQAIPVRVEAVERVRDARVPLLVDPGPPRVVLAWADSDSGTPRFARGIGGLDPSELGVSPSEYADAAYLGVDALDILRRVLAAARSRLRAWDRLHFSEMVVCRQPWLPESIPFPGVRALDWVGLCPKPAPEPGKPGRASHLVRLDAWEFHVVDRPAEPGLLARPIPLEFAGGPPPPTPAEAIIAWVVGESLGRGGQAPPPAVDPKSPPRWMRLAADALLADYRWGADYAWRRLLATWWEHEPASRRVEPATARAHAHLQRAVAWQAQRIGECISWSRTRRGPSPSIDFVSPLFGGEGFTDLLQSSLGPWGIAVRCADARWAERLGPPADRPEG